MPFVRPLMGPLFLTFPDFVVPAPLSLSNLRFPFGNSGIWVSEKFTINKVRLQVLLGGIWLL